MAEITQTEHDIARTFALLGGRTTIHRQIQTTMDAHDLLLEGLPTQALTQFVLCKPGSVVSDVALTKAVGISIRTLQRRKKDPDHSFLSAEQSNRIWKLAEVFGRASEIFGSGEEAEQWLNRPAIGLDQRKPIDLLATSVGAEAVENYLTRIAYGVYA